MRKSDTTGTQFNTRFFLIVLKGSRSFVDPEMLQQAISQAKAKKVKPETVAYLKDF
jgi:hypothetical protein